jgi:hypothetical protein
MHVLSNAAPGLAGSSPGTTFPRASRTPVQDQVTGRPGLTPRMRRATRALAEALFSTETGCPPADRLDWLEDEVDDFLAHAGPQARLVYRACLLGISSVAPVLVWRPPPLRRLPVKRRVRALERMERSPLGIAVFGAKALLCINYYEHPDAAREIGFDGRCGVEGSGPAVRGNGAAADPARGASS